MDSICRSERFPEAWVDKQPYTSNDLSFIAKTKATKANKLYWKTRFLDNQFGMKWFESNLSKKTITFSPRISKDLTSVEIISLDESYNRLPFLNSVANKERSISALEGGMDLA